jgi:hypothetical protein
MRDLDRMIDDALGQEESELLRSVSGEPSIVERALGMFGAGVGRMVVVMMMIQAAISSRACGQLGTSSRRPSQWPSSAGGYPRQCCC